MFLLRRVAIEKSLKTCVNDLHTIWTCQKFRFCAGGVMCKEHKDIATLKSNPYFDKYAEKIRDIQKSSSEELSVRLQAGQKLKGNCNLSDNCQSEPLQTKKKVLNDIVNVEILQAKSREEIIDIWLSYNNGRSDTFAAVLSKDVFQLIRQKSSLHPTFLLPLPREHGYEYIVCQFSGADVHFTPLINYHNFKENAPECLVLTHYEDFSDNKEIVLMKGEFNTDVLNLTEAKCLANQLQRYYGEDDDRRQRLLDRFTFKPQEFKHIDLIVELEKLAVR